MEEKEKKAQEMYMEYQMLDQHIKQLQKQLEAVANQLMEVNMTSHTLEELKSLKAGKEMFVPISSGIFAKASLSDTASLLVNVGANVVVRKDIESAKKLISTQVEELQKIQKKMADDLEKLINRAGQVEVELQKLMPQE